MKPLNIHGQWSFLAKKASLSRTAFAETFKAMSGWTAGRYVTWWRLQIAWQILIRGDSLMAAAHKTGNQSESVFSRTFKKEFFVSSGAVRRGTT